MKTTPPLFATFSLAWLIVSTATVQGQFNYETNNGTITITGYTGTGGSVTIPSTINRLPVTGIGRSAFSGCTSLTSVYLQGNAGKQPAVSWRPNQLPPVP